MKKQIWITFDKVGFHRYPDAPEEVAYLRDRHRHIFKFRVTMDVGHSNREVEFHMLKSWCVSLYETHALELDHKSCEMLAEELLDKLSERYNPFEFSVPRGMSVEVSEDGECGAIVQRG